MAARLRSHTRAGKIPLPEKNLQKGFDPTHITPYRPLHRRGRTDVSSVANRYGCPIPRTKERGGLVVRCFCLGEIFDIVGLDEGACGRRRLVLRSSRPRVSV